MESMNKNMILEDKGSFRIFLSFISENNIFNVLDSLLCDTLQ